MFYFDWYFIISWVKSIYNWLVGIFYEYIIILVNIDIYGGGGIYNLYILIIVYYFDF